MSLISQIRGWIEVDGYQNDHNYKVLENYPFTSRETPESDDDRYFPDIFTIPKWIGGRNPSYILFAMSINNFPGLKGWLKEFEKLLSELIAYDAYIFANEADDLRICLVHYTEQTEIRKPHGKWKKEILRAKFLGQMIGEEENEGD